MKALPSLFSSTCEDTPLKGKRKADEYFQESLLPFKRICLVSKRLEYMKESIMAEQSRIAKEMIEASLRSTFGKQLLDILESTLHEIKRVWQPIIEERILRRQLTTACERFIA